ncbi:hypothetical protein ACWCSD_34450 [Nonomuraea sp. NPDC001684]
MNTPIYDALVAELREQRYTNTAPFPRAMAEAPPPPAPPASGWFTPAPAAAPQRAVPRGFHDLAAILARTSLEYGPAPAPAVIDATPVGACA